MLTQSFGLILANRAVVLGAIQARDLIDIAVARPRTRAPSTPWVGDSLLAKPRLEAVALLSALAGATVAPAARGRLHGHVRPPPPPHCSPSSGRASTSSPAAGRSLAVCLGGPDERAPRRPLEHAVMGIASGERVGRLEEGIQILRKSSAGRRSRTRASSTSSRA